MRDTSSVSHETQWYVLLQSKVWETEKEREKERGECKVSLQSLTQGGAVYTHTNTHTEQSILGPLSPGPLPANWTLLSPQTHKYKQDYYGKRQCRSHTHTPHTHTHTHAHTHRLVKHSQWPQGQVWVNRTYWSVHTNTDILIQTWNQQYRIPYQ